MKKKGLIISTIVMVVVLIAALTTSTYAWFTASDNAQVGNVQFTVVQGGDVLIGAQFANTLPADPTADMFLTGNLTWDAEATGADIDSSPKWSGGTRGLSSNSVSFGGIMSATLEKAIGFGTPNTTVYQEDADGTYYLDNDEYKTPLPENYSGTKYKPVYNGTAGATFDSAHVVKANGNDTILSPATVVAAEENIDYIHLVIGVKAGREGLDTISLTMTLTDTTAGKQTLGMMAATHYTYGINTAATNTNNTEFCGTSTHYDATYASQDQTITIVDSEGAGINVSTIYVLDLYIWIDGNDTDCNMSALGSQLQIAFSIDKTEIE